LGRKAEALADLNDWCASHLVSQELTEDQIVGFYTNQYKFTKPLNSQKMSSSFIVSEDIEPIVQCILHFRRIETVFEGLRWFDIKRYGIEITHYIGSDRREILTWNDSRRAIQIPQDVIAAGIQENPQKTTPSNKNEIQPLVR
jgi:hypothetical protein